MKRRDLLVRVAAGVLLPGTLRSETAEPCPPPSIGLPEGLPASTSCSRSQVPAWFQALSHRQWATPVANWLGASGVVPNPLPGGLTGHSAIISAWTGMGADQTRKWLFMLHNGGHNDYYGNEVYSCDLSQEEPVWIRRRNPSSASGSGNISKFSDGRPSSDHTTNSHVEGEGRWFTPGMNSTNYNGFANNHQWFEYDIASEDYRDLGSRHAPTSNAVQGLALWDPTDRQVVVVHPDNQGTNPSVEFQDIDNMSGAPALVNTSWLDFAHSPMGAIDTTNRILLVRGNNAYRWLKLSSADEKQSNWKSISASGTAPSALHQFHWHAPSRAFITWDGATGLRKLTPTLSAGNYTALTWTSVSGAGGDAPTTSGPSAGMYNKIQLIHDMGDGTSAMIVVPRYANPDTYVMRLVGAV